MCVLQCGTLLLVDSQDGVSFLQILTSEQLGPRVSVMFDVCCHVLVCCHVMFVITLFVMLLPYTLCLLSCCYVCCHVVMSMFVVMLLSYMLLCLLTQVGGGIFSSHVRRSIQY